MFAKKVAHKKKVSTIIFFILLQYPGARGGGVVLQTIAIVYRQELLNQRQ